MLYLTKLLIIISAYFVVVLQPMLVQYEHFNQNTLKKSQESYDTLFKLSRTNPCIKQALEKFNENCRTMDDIAQSLLALELTNCHLSKSKRKTYYCEPSMSFEECSSKLDSEAFDTYTSFYLHAENICFFHKSLMWYQESEQMINKMVYFSSELSERMHDNYKETKRISDLHSKLEHDVQHNIDLTTKSNGMLDKTFKYFEDMHERIVKGFSNVLQNLKLQEENISEVFEKLNKELQFIKELQIWLVYDCFNLESFFFYLIVFFVIMLVTSHARFVRTGFSLRIVINYIVEKLVYDVLKVTKLLANERNELFQILVKYERAMFLLVCLKMLYDHYKSYVDFNQLILQEVQVLKERSLNDSAVLKENIKSQLIYLLKNSLKKLSLSKIREQSEEEKKILGTEDIPEDLREKLGL